MTTRLRITDRDTEILRALAVHIRLFSQRQIADHWFEGEVSNARRRMRQLVRDGLVHRLTVLARPVPELARPVVRWRPGEPEPNLSQASYTFRSRWRDRPLRECTSYIATSRTAKRFGGRVHGELKNGLHATHDLGVARIWLHFDEHFPRWADAWRGEDLMAHTRRGEKLPDGFIVDAQEQVVCVIEFGGSYDEQRVREFHDDCRQRQLSYQIW